MDRQQAHIPPPGKRCARLLVRLAAEDLALFRFLLEGYDNLAYFTVLERRPALLKLVCAQESLAALRGALSEISQSLSLRIEEWPFPPLESA